MLLGAARRFLGLLALASAVTLPISVLFGVLADSSLARAISLGFYCVGSFLLIGGFFVGNRGPVRLKKEDSAEGMGMPLLGLPLIGGRAVRWASREEREDAISTSAVLVVLGLVLILIGVAADSRVKLL